MASSFDSNDWIKKLLVSQSAVQRALEPYRQTHVLGATVGSQQIKQMREWAEAYNETLAGIIDQAHSVLDGPARRLHQAQEQLERIVKSYDIASGLRQLADFTKEVEESYRQALPVNWRPLTFEEALRASALTHDEGVPLVWVPGSEMTAEVCEKAEREEAMAFLVEEQARVLSDVEVTLGELVDQDLTGWACKTREAINAYRDGHASPAQALAAAVITAGLERGMRFKKLQDVRKLANRLSPDEAELALYRTSLVVQLGSRCVQGTGFEKPGFNRGASLHEVREDQYNGENSLAAIMIAASILREAQELRQSGMLVSEDADSLVVSNGGAPSD
jgi:hypothetical protein